MTKPKTPAPIVVGQHGVKVYPPHPSKSGHGATMHRIVWTRPNGKRKGAWRTDRDDAMQVAAEVDRQLDLVNQGHTEPDAARLERQRTVADLADLWLLPATHEDPWSIHHQRNNDGIVNKWIKPHLGHLRLDEITDDGLRDFLNRTVRPRYPKSVRRIGVALSAMFKLGVDRKWIATDPMAAVKYGNGGRAKRQGVSAVYVPLDQRPDTASVRQLADTVDRLWPKERLGDAVLLAAFSGIRRGELFALTDRDLEFPDGGARLDIVRQVFHMPGERHVHLPKYEKIRETIAPADVADRLADRLTWTLPSALRTGCTVDCHEQQPTGGRLLFPTLQARTWWTSSNFDSRRFGPARVEAGWPRDPDGGWRWTWHDLRHHAATWMLAPKHADGLGLEVADVSYFLGHATPEFTWKAYVSPREGAVSRALGT